MLLKEQTPPSPKFLVRNQLFTDCLNAMTTFLLLEFRCTLTPFMSFCIYNYVILIIDLSWHVFFAELATACQMFKYGACEMKTKHLNVLNKCLFIIKNIFHSNNRHIQKYWENKKQNVQSLELLGLVLKPLCNMQQSRNSYDLFL